MQVNILIGICGTLAGIIFSYISFQRNKTTDIKQDAKEDTKSKVELNTKLDVLLSNNTEIKSSIKEMNNKFDEFKDDTTERLTKVEASTKYAHDRIDKLEGVK